MVATRALSANAPVACPAGVRARPATAVKDASVVRAPVVQSRKALKLNVACKATTEDMSAAEKRWESQIKEGKVRNVTCKGAGDLLKDGWTLLDVRPTNEIRKASVDGAVKVPLFVPDTKLDPASLLKQMSAFGMGGWWLGGTHMEPNENFMAEVQEKIPKDAKVVVACQKGLRSLAACEQLSRAGYQTLAWVNGGFDTALKGDLPTVQEKDLRMAGVGGLSEALGMTPAQQSVEREEPTGAENIIKIAIAIVVLDLAVFGYEQIQYLLNQ